MEERVAELEKRFVELVENQARLEAENERLRDENKRLSSRCERLQERLSALLKRYFGTKSEKIDPNQMLLDLGKIVSSIETDDDDDPTPPSGTRRRRRGKRRQLPDNLEEVREVIDPVEVQANPDAYECIGEEEDVRLDVEPMRVFKRVTVRRKYRRRDRASAPVIAPAVKHLIPNSIATSGLLAFIIVSKYVDHLPLYRQEGILRRFGVELGRKRMSYWVQQVGDALRTIYEQMKLEAFAGGYLQIDETPVQYLSPGNGKTLKGYMWVALSPGVSVFCDWHTGRSSVCLRPMLNGFTGDAQSDGYAGYGAYNIWRGENGLERLKLHACWAHARRKFFDARGPKVAEEVLLLIQKLYRVEARLRKCNAGPAERVRERKEHSLPVLNKIKSLMQAAPHILPQSALGKAVSYTQGLWPKLTSYVDDGRIEIDNNLVENAIRPTALGRKNWMFIGDAEAGKASAIIYSVVQTCRMLDINVRDYLVDVFNRLPYATAKEARALTPAKWKSESEAMTVVQTA